MNISHTSGAKCKGLFVVLEGGEGSGKSTQARLLSEALEMHGYPTHLTREPGDTELGIELRAILLDRNRRPKSRRAEMLLFAADRAEHVAGVIKPQLDEGKVVICDRYMASTMAYQAHAGGLDEMMVRMISEWASCYLAPDITYFLDVDPVIGLERAMLRSAVERTRFEEKSVDYHDKVRRGFLLQRDDTWLTVDAFKSIEKVHSNILGHALRALNVLNGIAFVQAPRFM